MIISNVQVNQNIFAHFPRTALFTCNLVLSAYCSIYWDILLNLKQQAWFWGQNSPLLP